MSTAAALQTPPTQPPAAVPPPSPATPATPPAAAAPAAADWTSALNDDLKGWVSTKGYKSQADVAEAARGLEKLLGGPRERLMTLPERFYDDAGKLTAEGRSLRERLGAPKEAKEYDLKMPETGGDPKLMEHFKSVFHEAGVPKSDAEKIVSSWNQYQKDQANAIKEQAANRFKEEETSLSKEWGAALEQNTNIAKEAVRTMGLKKEQIEAIGAVLGHAETMKLFHKFGKQVGEAPFIGGTRPDTIAEPLAARQQIKELIRDKAFGEKLAAGDKDSMAKWERLHQQAHPGDYKG